MEFTNNEEQKKSPKRKPVLFLGNKQNMLLDNHPWEKATGLVQEKLGYRSVWSKAFPSLFIELEPTPEAPE